MAKPPLEIIILAAGQGTRMKSSLPKVLHALAGKPLLAHVIDTAMLLEPSAIHVVYGHGGEQVKATLGHYEVNWVHQPEQLGTGHAVECALPHVADASSVLVLYGDVPLVSQETLSELLNDSGSETLKLLTVRLANPKGYGRIVRNSAGDVERIVEEKDASNEQRHITEVNTGIMAMSAARLKPWIQRLDNANAQGEFYLTDVIALSVADGVAVQTTTVADQDEVLGINDRAQQAHLERVFQLRQAQTLMRAGITLIDPARFDLRGELIAGQDVVIDCNVVIEGKVKLGNRVTIGANCVLKDVHIGDDVEIKPMSIIEQGEVGAACVIGPFARIRPGTVLAAKARIGNFVEVKNSRIGQGSKVNHLSYIGDTEMGSGVNIGAGTITCNYDGANKHKTVIGDDAFIGSDSQLVAPVTVGKGATIGAGSTITKDTPEGELTLCRGKQKTINGWKRPVKQK